VQAETDVQPVVEPDVKIPSGHDVQGLSPEEEKKPEGHGNETDL